MTRPHPGYSDRLMDHFMNPRHVGVLSDANGVGEVKNNTCGDVTRIFLRIEGGVLRAARFQAHGCGPGIACASYLLERVVGRPLADALAVTPASIARALELPAAKRHAAELAVSALRQAADHAIGGNAR